MYFSLSPNALTCGNVRPLGFEPRTFQFRASWAVDLEPTAGSVGDRVEVAGVRAHDEVTASKRSFHHADVDDVGHRGAGGQCADGACLLVFQWFDVATDEQTRQQGLSASVAPRLRDDGCRSRRHYAAGQQRAMSRPHPPLAAVGCYERASVVSDAHYALLR